MKEKKTAKNGNKNMSRLWLALSILLFIYGMIIRSLGTGTFFFAVWLGLAFIAFLLSIAAKKEAWSRLPGIIRKLLIIFLSLGLAVFFIIEACVLSGFDEKGRDDLDYIIVLGAQVYDSGPSRVLKFRLDCALDYLNDNPDTICIVSGGQGSNEPRTEAEVMAQYLENRGIPADRILLEKESKTTAENIRNCKSLIDDDACVGLITNNFHVFRAVQTARKNGLENVCGIAAGSTAFYLPNNMFREFFGEIKFLLTSI